jgi:DNA (cytosine-5)-methyltransferase 1
MRKLRILDLFSGIGGFSLGLERTGGFETAAFCEIEPFPRRVLAKHWPGVPIHMDVRKLRGEDVGPVDVICGGYPCQPFSTAGKRAGKEDDRHLWPEFSRLVDELRPAWVIGENVAGHISMGLDDVLADLEGKGYACRAFVIPACGVGAPHKRDRVWIIGNADKDPREQSQTMAEHNGAEQYNGVGVFNVANANGKRQQGPGALGQSVDYATLELREADQSFYAVGWPTEPAICGATDGFSSGVDRLRALGNAVVPQIPEMIGRAILAAEAASRHPI